MKTATRVRLGLMMLILLIFGVGANAQTREEFVEIEQGFKVSKAIEEDGSRALLVLFPEKYLTSPVEFAEGTLVVLPLILGCEPFPECKPETASMEKNKDGLTVVYINTVHPKFKIAVRGLGDGKQKPVGIIVQLYQVPDKIMGGKLTR